MPQCRGIWRKSSLIFYETDLFDLQILACFSCYVSSSVWKGKSCWWTKADAKTKMLSSTTLTCFDSASIIFIVSCCRRVRLSPVLAEALLSSPIVSIISGLQTGDGRRTWACQHPAVSLLLVFWTHRIFLGVCCTCQGGM